MAPFKRLGTVAFHKLDDEKPLIRISRMVAGLLAEPQRLMPHP